jgi:hypothetical protein
MAQRTHVWFQGHGMTIGGSLRVRRDARRDGGTTAQAKRWLQTVEQAHLRSSSSSGALL